MQFRSALIRIAAITMIIVLIAPVSFGPNNVQDYLVGVGFAAFLVSLGLIIVGTIVAIPPRSRTSGQAMLVTGAALLLLSFTLCSTGQIYL